ncbi:MAG: ParA family protein [Verrucomicrobiota bacterium]
MIITLCNQKGGAGKTTLTLLLAMALEDVGRRVAVIDRDPQATSSRAIANLNANGLSKIEVLSSAADHDVTFIDTAPRLNESLGRSIAESSRVILVSSPSPADLWSTQESRDFVLRHLSPGAKTAILFNSVVKGSRISRDLEVLAGHIQLPALRNCTVRRQCYQYAILQGWGALKSVERDEIKSAALEIGTM